MRSHLLFAAPAVSSRAATSASMSPSGRNWLTRAAVVVILGRLVLSRFLQGAGVRGHGQACPDRICSLGSLGELVRQDKDPANRTPVCAMLRWARLVSVAARAPLPGWVVAPPAYRAASTQCSTGVQGPPFHTNRCPAAFHDSPKAGKEAGGWDAKSPGVLPKVEGWRLPVRLDDLLPLGYLLLALPIGHLPLHPLTDVARERSGDRRALLLSHPLEQLSRLAQALGVVAQAAQQVLVGRGWGGKEKRAVLAQVRAPCLAPRPGSPRPSARSRPAP